MAKLRTRRNGWTNHRTAHFLRQAQLVRIATEQGKPTRKFKGIVPRNIHDHHAKFCKDRAHWWQP